MQAAEVLTVLAEISIALAGFAGIVVALRQRGIAGFQLHELVRLRFMLGVGCELLFLALLPFLFHYLGLAKSTWVLSSYVMSAGLTALVVLSYLQTRDPILSKSPWTRGYITGTTIFAAMAFVNGYEFIGPANVAKCC